VSSTTGRSQKTCSLAAVNDAKHLVNAGFRGGPTLLLKNELLHFALRCNALGGGFIGADFEKARLTEFAFDGAALRGDFQHVAKPQAFECGETENRNFAAVHKPAVVAVLADAHASRCGCLGGTTTSKVSMRLALNHWQP